MAERDTADGNMGDRGTEKADTTEAARAWSASGMASLTGRPNGPALGGPVHLVEGAHRLARAIERHSTRLGDPVVVDPLALMAERAEVAGLRRAGSASCGGASRLLPCLDGWTAVSLARPADWELVAALLDRPGPVVDGDWTTVEAGVGRRTGVELRQRAELLGLPLALLGERRTPDHRPATTAEIPGIRARRVADDPPALAVGGLDRLAVADLSSLWAGPLVGRLLLRAGARVTKIESWGRPDGTRYGPPEFFDLLNTGKASVALDLATPEGRRLLHCVVEDADLVITSCRPRALEQLDLDIHRIVGTGRPRVWLAITGYGSDPESRQRVAFGDDAAVAGGLVAWDEQGPCFCGDAVADPLCGLASTAAVLGALEAGGSWVLEASMADIAGGLVGPALPVGARTAVRPATPRTHGAAPVSPAPPLGADTGAFLAALRSAGAAGTRSPAGSQIPGSRYDSKRTSQGGSSSGQQARRTGKGEM